MVVPSLADLEIEPVVLPREAFFAPAVVEVGGVDAGMVLPDATDAVFERVRVVASG